MRDDAIRTWAKGSRFLDDLGLPVTWYHGTNAETPFNVFTLCDEGSVGYHFGCAATASTRCEHLEDGELEGMSVIPVLCRASNPVRLPDLHCWTPLACITALEDSGIVTQQEADDLYDEGCLELTTLYALLEMAGYDSVVYENVTEGARTDSLFVWRAELLKSPFSHAFDRNDPRLLSQIPTSGTDLDDWRRTAAEIDEEIDRLERDRGIRLTQAPACPADAGFRPRP